MATNKCDCGYEFKFPGEQEMFEKWGCGKAREKRSGPFNSLEVILCSNDSGETQDAKSEHTDSAELKEAYMDKYKPKDNK